MTDDGQSELIPCKCILEVLSVLSSKQSQHSLASLLEDFASSHEQCSGTGTSSLVCYALLLASELHRVDASADSVKEALEIVEKVFITVCRSIAYDGNDSHGRECEEEFAAVDTVPFEESQQVRGYEEVCLSVDAADDVDWFFDTSTPHDSNSTGNDSTNGGDDTTINQHKNNPLLSGDPDAVPSPLNLQLAKGLDHCFPWEFEFPTSTDSASTSTSATGGLSLPMRLASTAAEIMWGPLPLSPSTTHSSLSHSHSQQQPAGSDDGQGLGASSEPLSLDRMRVHTLAGVSSARSGVHGDAVIFLCDRRTAHASVAVEGKRVRG